MPTEEDYYHPQTIYFRDGFAYCPRDRLLGGYEEHPRRTETKPKKKSRKKNQRRPSLVEFPRRSEYNWIKRDFWMDCGD